MAGSDPVREAKRRAALEAIAMVRDGQVVGLGTGSTAAEAILVLGRRVREEELTIIGIPTSRAAERLALEQGIRIGSLDEVSGVDVAIDGADEVDPNRNLIKGGGGAHTREKIVASVASLFIVIVDESKLVDRLGRTFPVPVEVLPMAARPVTRRIGELGGAAVLRTAKGGTDPFVTDQGNWILDARFPCIDEPASLERDLNAIPGVLDNGLFIDMADLVLVGTTGKPGVKRIG